MARTKVQISANELQGVINQLEETKLFSSPHKLYEAVAQTPWARDLSITSVMVYLRVKELNADPSNPGITMKVKPARKVGPREPGGQGESRPTAKTRNPKPTGVTIDGLDLLMDSFRSYGIEVTVVEDLITSSMNTVEQNRAILLAWADIRNKLRIPKPAKKEASSVSGREVTSTVQPVIDTMALGEGITVVEKPTPEDLVAESVVSVGEVIESPIAEEPVEGSMVPGVTVTEEMPDGGPVSVQGGQEVAPDVEPVMEPVTAAEPSEPAPSVATVPVMMAPSPIQMKQVRPVPARPTPVRSSLPPRPMPVNRS